MTTLALVLLIVGFLAFVVFAAGATISANSQTINEMADTVAGWGIRLALPLLLLGTAALCAAAALAPDPACPERSTMIRKFTGYQTELVGKVIEDVPTYSITCEDP